MANKHILRSKNYATLYLKIYSKNFFETWSLSGCSEKRKMPYFEKTIFQKIPLWCKWSIHAQFWAKVKETSAKGFFEFLYHEIEQRVDKKVTTEISKKVFHLGQIHHFRWFWPNIMEI